MKLWSRCTARKMDGPALSRWYCSRSCCCSIWTGSSRCEGRCDTSQVESPCTTVRALSRGDRWRKYYHFTQDWAEIHDLFASYWQRTLDLSGWEDQVEEQLTANLSDLPQPTAETFPWADGLLMKVAEILSQGDPYVLEKLNTSLSGPALLQRAQNAPAPGSLRNEMTPKEQVLLEYYTKWEDMPRDPISARFLNETRRAKWLSKGMTLAVKDLLWTCFQWDVMVGLLFQADTDYKRPVGHRPRVSGRSGLEPCDAWSAA